MKLYFILTPQQLNSLVFLFNQRNANHANTCKVEMKTYKLLIQFDWQDAFLRLVLIKMFKSKLQIGDTVF